MARSLISDQHNKTQNVLDHVGNILFNIALKGTLNIFLCQALSHSCCHRNIDIENVQTASLKSIAKLINRILQKKQIHKN